ncbi:hypothetical protein Hanom_Chr05g00418371 [Helianthus anomalus]
MELPRETYTEKRRDNRGCRDLLFVAFSHAAMVLFVPQLSYAYHHPTYWVFIYGCYTTPRVGLPWLIFISSPPIKHHRRFYPPPFRLQPHHPAEPLTPPSTVKVSLLV